MRSSQAFWELRRQKGLHRRWVPQKGELGAEPGFVALQLNGLTLTARGMGSEVLPRRARGSEFAGRARGTERSAWSVSSPGLWLAQKFQIIIFKKTTGIVFSIGT